MIFNPLVSLLSSLRFVPSSNIRVISLISSFYFFVFSSLSSCFLLLIVYLLRPYLCLLFLDPLVYLTLFLQLAAPASLSSCQFVSVTDKNEQGQASLSEYFSFPLPVSFHQCSILIHSSLTLHKMSFNTIKNYYSILNCFSTYFIYFFFLITLLALYFHTPLQLCFSCPPFFYFLVVPLSAMIDVGLKRVRTDEVGTPA